MKRRTAAVGFALGALSPQSLVIAQPASKVDLPRFRGRVDI